MGDIPTQNILASYRRTNNCLRNKISEYHRPGIEPGLAEYLPVLELTREPPIQILKAKFASNRIMTALYCICLFTLMDKVDIVTYLLVLEIRTRVIAQD